MEIFKSLSKNFPHKIWTVSEVFNLWRPELKMLNSFFLFLRFLNYFKERMSFEKNFIERNMFPVKLNSKKMKEFSFRRTFTMKIKVLENLDKAYFRYSYIIIVKYLVNRQTRGKSEFDYY